MKRIGLIDVDGGKRFPNIVLMKLSAWHKAQGDIVEWYNPFDGWYDKVYMSKVFSFSPDYDYSINASEVIKGGSGYAISLREGRETYDKDKEGGLPYEVEHIYPDYSIYPLLTRDTAFGFLTRGCPRGCAFCHVATKEGKCSRKVANLDEFWSGQKNIVLCDPNILACKDWKELLQQLIDSEAVVDFNQGLDIRMMTPEKIEMLRKIKIKELHFAWDRYEDKDAIIPKFKMFSELYHKGKERSHNTIVFTITNFTTTIEQDLERIYTLREMGYWAYVAIYDIAHAKPIYKKLQRWVNNRFIFAKCKTFEEYQHAKTASDNMPRLF